jgi:hypothetical protein
MEREAIFNLKINTGNSAKNISEAEKELKKLRENIKNSGSDTKSLESNLKKLDETVAKGSLAYTDLNKVIKDYQTIALRAGAETPIGMQALENASKLKDTQSDLASSTRKLADDGRNLQAALGIGQGVLAGYTAFQGVTAMLGVENEKMLETITKLQAAQSTLVSVQQVAKLLENDSIVVLRTKNALMIANNTITSLSTKLLKLFNIQVVAGNVALTATNILFQALGIGLIVAAIALLVNYWEDLTNAVSNSVKALANFVGIRNEAFENEKEQAAQRQKMIAKDIENIQDRLSAEEKALDNRIKLMKAEGKETESLENQKIKIRIKANEAQKQLLKEEAIIIETRRRMNGTLSEEETKRFEDIKKSYIDLIRANKDLNVQLEVNEINSQNKRKETAAKNRQQRLEEEKKAGELELELQRFLEDLKLRGMQESESKRRQQIKINQQRESADLVARYGQNTELIKQLELVQAKELEEFENQIKLENQAKETEEALLQMENDLMKIENDFHLRLNKELELEAFRRDILLQNENLTAAEKERINLEYAEKEADINQKRLDNEKALQKAKVEMTKNALFIIGNLAELFAGNSEAQQKKAFELNKKVQSSMAAINTFQAVTGALAEPSIIPGERFVKAAAAGTAGLLQIRKIMSTQFQSGQSGGGSNISAPPTSVSQDQNQAIFRGLQDAGVRNDTSDNNNSGGGSQQVFVLETDIRNVTDRVNAIETRSRVG